VNTPAVGKCSFTPCPLGQDVCPQLRGPGGALMARLEYSIVDDCGIGCGAFRQIGPAAPAEPFHASPSGTLPGQYSASAKRFPGTAESPPPNDDRFLPRNMGAVAVGPHSDTPVPITLFFARDAEACAAGPRGHEQHVRNQGRLPRSEPSDKISPSPRSTAITVP